MTAKEKAEELRERCDGYKCYALVAVDEILNVVNDIWMDSFTSGKSDNKFYNYWYEVREELVDKY